jgi:hypothetical protein
LHTNLPIVTLIDFKTLDSMRFHSLSNDLVKAEYSEATCLEGSGGDEGIDCFVGNNIDTDNLHVFQHKFFTTTLTNSGKGQIKKSLGKVLSEHPNISRWTLVIAKDPTPGEIKWFDQLRAVHPTINLILWDNTKLKDLLRKYYRIYYQYFPLPEHIDKKITNHLDDLKGKVVQPLLSYIQNLSMENILPIINSELCKDLITNHYPSLDTKLQNLMSYSGGIESQSIEYRSQIKTLLEHYLVIDGIKSRNDKSGTYIMIDSIPINQFTERLWPLVESGSYSDNKFRLDTGYPDMVRIGFGDLGQGVMYQCLPNENCEEIMRKLQSICRIIIYKTNDELSKYNETKSARSKLIQDLSQELDGIQYTHKLRFEKIDSLECKYFNY